MFTPVYTRLHVWYFLFLTPSFWFLSLSLSLFVRLSRSLFEDRSNPGHGPTGHGARISGPGASISSPLMKLGTQSPEP